MSPRTAQPVTFESCLALSAGWTLEQLRRHYGSQGRQQPLEPVDELIMTVLSQNTSDSNTERAFASLRAGFPDWESVASASAAEVVDAIRVGGLANTKGPRIQQILRIIRGRRGNYDLRFLGTLPVEEATNWLTSLPGVGPKTAACVLLFSLDVPVLPVDTHVHRVARRIGLVSADASAYQTQQELERQIHDADRFEAHMLFIRHGRAVCQARKPKCDVCVLGSSCPSHNLIGID